MKKFEVCDCTLRDGGYYTNWDFSKSLVENYLEAMEYLPVDIIEVGYRQRVEDSYAGEYFNIPINRLKWIKEKAPSKKIAIMLNGADVNIHNIGELVDPIVNFVDIVRIAVRPDKIDESIILFNYLKDKGFKTAANIMYLSNYADDENIVSIIASLGLTCNYLNLVDSYGGMYPDKIGEFFKSFKLKVQGDAKIGFHGHNNLELAFANAIIAVENGCQAIDSTLTGMGRGAGNLETELLLTWMTTKQNIPVNFNHLSNIVEIFEELKSKYHWGTQLPYMVSGGHSLPQKKVMDWVTKRFYSINSIIQKLNNEKNGIEDNVQFPIFRAETITNKTIIIGGGQSVSEHLEAILQFITYNKSDICLIHSNSINIKYFKDVEIPQYHILMGNEGYRLQKIITNFDKFTGLCLLPPYPRKMGTYLPETLKDQTFQLDAKGFNFKYSDSCTYTAIKLALELKSTQIFSIGFDGYQGTILQRELELAAENEDIFQEFSDIGIKIKSITPTVYKNLQKQTIYTYLMK